MFLLFVRLIRLKGCEQNVYWQKKNEFNSSPLFMLCGFIEWQK